MRKIILWVHVSLDGFVGGPNGEMEWTVYDEQFDKYPNSIYFMKACMQG